MTTRFALKMTADEAEQLEYLSRLMGRTKGGVTREAIKQLYARMLAEIRAKEPSTPVP